MSVCCLLFFRVQRKVVSLCVYREGDWLRLEGVRNRYDSINTLVMLMSLEQFLSQLVIIKYGHVFDIQCTHQSITSNNHVCNPIN